MTHPTPTRRLRQPTGSARPRQSTSPTRAVIVALLTALAGCPAGSALAQTPTDAGALMRDAQRAEREAAPAREPQPLIDEAAPRSAIRLPEGATLEVARFRITGNRAIADDVLADLVRPWEGRTLDVNGLNDAAGAITRHYQNRGYLLAYAYLPAQRIVQGVVEIAVLEGTIDAVQIVTAQDVRLRDEVIQRHLEGVESAPQVLQQDIERRLLLLNDIPGVVARAAFTPGARPGTADIVVTVAEEEPLTNAIDFNNHGSNTTGEFRLGARFQLRNLFGWGDSTQFRVLASEEGRLVNGHLITRVPLGGQGWVAEAGLSRLTYELGAPFSVLGARGEANVLHVGGQYALSRGMHANLSLLARYEYKDLEDKLAAVPNNRNQKHSHLLSVGVQGSRRDALLGGGHSLGLLQLAAGSLHWDSSRPAGAPSGAFTKLSLDGSRRQALVGNWNLYGRLSGQYGFNGLDSSEKYALTGPYGVRAYAPGELNVDRGALLALELRHTWALTGSTLTGSLFHDLARGRIAADNQPILRGTGLGLAWSNADDLDFSLSAAWRGNRTPTSGDDRRPYIYFVMNVGF